jgi:hypothetical protein
MRVNKKAGYFAALGLFVVGLGSFGFWYEENAKDGLTEPVISLGNSGILLGVKAKGVNNEDILSRMRGGCEYYFLREKENGIRMFEGGGCKVREKELGEPRNLT